jgi:hypothetical protein
MHHFCFILRRDYLTIDINNTILQIPSHARSPSKETQEPGAELGKKLCGAQEQQASTNWKYTCLFGHFLSVK